VEGSSGPEVTGKARLVSCCLLPAVQKKSPHVRRAGSIVARSKRTQSRRTLHFFHESAPTICVEIFTAAVRAHKRSEPCARAPTLIDAFKRVITMHAGQMAPVRMRSGLEIGCCLLRARRGSHRTVGPRHLWKLRASKEQRACLYAVQEYSRISSGNCEQSIERRGPPAANTLAAS